MSMPPEPDFSFLYLNNKHIDLFLLYDYAHRHDPSELPLMLPLTADEQTAVKAHLGECAQCRASLRRLEGNTEPGDRKIRPPHPGVA